MNKYIVPICDIQAGQVWNHIVMARTINECQDKIMETLIEKYDFEDSFTYREFIEFLDDHDILIGEITDIETL